MRQISVVLRRLMDSNTFFRGRINKFWSEVAQKAEINWSVSRLKKRKNPTRGGKAKGKKKSRSQIHMDIIKPLGWKNSHACLDARCIQLINECSWDGQRLFVCCDFWSDFWIYHSWILKSGMQPPACIKAFMFNMIDQACPSAFDSLTRRGLWRPRILSRIG